MDRNIVLTERDHERLQEMLRWFNRNKNIRHQFRRRNISIKRVGINFKIFEVQSEATGDGLYICREEKLLSEKWEDETGEDKFDEKNTTEYTVLNLLEANPESEYVAHLTAGDLIKTFQTVDDNGVLRWIGTPLRDDRRRIAYCKDDAGVGSTIDCYLDKDETGTEITVHCNISQGGGVLNTTMPRLRDGDPIIVQKIFDGTNDYWWCVGLPFAPSIYCTCGGA